MKSTAKQPEITDEVLGILRSHDVIKAYAFGSYVHDDMTDQSDLDLLVTYKPGVSYFDHLDLQTILEQKTGRKVDLITELHPSFRPYIEPELVELPL